MNGLEIEKEDFSRTVKSRFLLEDPFSYQHPLADKVFITAQVTFSKDRKTVFCDVDDKTPTATLFTDLKDYLKNKFKTVVPMVRDVQEGKCGPHSLVSGGSVLTLHFNDAAQSSQKIMLRRSLYLKGTKDFISSPLALNQPIGRCGEPLSQTMVKEANEEVLLYLKEQKSFLSTLFQGRGLYHPVMLSLNGSTGMEAGQKERLVQEWMKYVSDPNKEINIEMPDRQKFLQQAGNIITLNVKDEEADLSRYMDVVTRINGKEFDVASGIPFFDTEGNTAEFNKSLSLQIPSGLDYGFVAGCEPDFSRYAGLYDDQSLRTMPLAPSRPQETNQKPGGLTTSPYGYINKYQSDMAFGVTSANDNPLKKRVEKLNGPI